MTHILDLDEGELITVTDGRTYAEPFGRRDLEHQVVVVQAPEGPEPATLEAVRSAAGVLGASRFAACAAAAAGRGAAGTLTIVDLTWKAARTARVEIDGAQITVSAARDVPGLDGGSFTALFAVDQDGLRTELLAQGAFLLEASVAAAGDPIFQDVPAVTVAGQPITVGQLEAGFAGHRAVLRSLFADADSAGQTVLTGAFAAFALLVAAVEEATGRTPLVIPDAVVEGALSLAEGIYHEPFAERASVRVPVNRLRGGRLEDRLVALPSGVGEFAEIDGAELILAKGLEIAGALLTERTLPVELDGSPREIDLAQAPPGPYRLGVRHTRAGEPLIVLRGVTETLFLSPAEPGVRP